MFLEQQTPIDLHLAKRLRYIRNTSGVTQNELGELIGVTLQQIHKYESGLNKISASRLYEICRVLNRPMNSFFERVPIDRGYYNFDYVPEFEVLTKDQERNKEIQNLIKYFSQIEDEEIRINIINLVSSIASGNKK